VAKVATIATKDGTIMVDRVFFASEVFQTRIRCSEIIEKTSATNVSIICHDV
jgi:hypothetical protein